uniref:MucB/RseB C-terminal domain-containing protein n=1 Tax=Ningiella ruwaisensis TaxID=2364274 RepID=UPI001444B0C7|nr:MucB/RseB C-terminal domain-containing protein [Ningiella ruwaisensis]
MKNRINHTVAVISGFFASKALVSMCLLFASLSFAQVPPNETAEALEQEPKESQVNDLDSSSQMLENEGENNAVRNFDPLSAESWMRRLINNVESSAFEIIYVVTANKRETLPYMWRKGKMPDASQIEQLSLLNGPGFEQIAHQGKVSIFEPGFAPYSVQGNNVQGPIPQAFIYEGIDFTNAYDVLLMGRNRIAGRMAQQIRVISKDKTRFNYHLWLDEQTGFLLKLDMYNLEGDLLEQIQITQLNISENVNQIFSQFSVDQLPQVNVKQNAAPRELIWQVSYLPEGMKVIRQDIHRIERTGQVTEYMLLSDGLVDVSVYVMNANSAFEEDVSVASNSHAVVSKTDGRVQVTVVGEVPVATADRIANSIVITEQAQNNADAIQNGQPQ